MSEARETGTTIAAESLRGWVRALVSAWGYTDEDASFLGDSLVDANLRGVDSHGVMRLPAYAARVEAGLIVPTARPSVSIRAAVATVDAQRAAGQIAAREAVRAVSALSTEFGVASAAVRGSAHFGAAGYYARMLAEQGKVAIVLSNSEPAVVPHGGREALLGTNPIAFAAPTAGAPVSLDMATSTVAMGKVLVAQARGERIPTDWGVASDGAPTDDPAAVSALLPVGGPKGYGLGMLVEILAGVLTGASVAGDLGSMYTDMSRTQDVGHWMLALDTGAFLPAGVFQQRMESLVGEAHAAPPRDPERPVLVPGEPEERTSAVRAADGIPVPADTVRQLRELGLRYGVPADTIT